MKRYIRWEELKLDNSSDDDEEVNDEQPNMQMLHHIINENLVTPFGIFRPNSQLNPMNDRTILIANTNFNLTAKLIQAICAVDGVESVRVISRYTIVVMIGTLFDENVVVYKINDICGIDEESVSLEDLSDEESKLILNASDKSKYWLAYLFPNGKEYIETFESLEELEKSIGYFRELNGFSEGKLFSSEKLENYLEEDIE